MEAEPVQEGLENETSDKTEAQDQSKDDNPDPNEETSELMDVDKDANEDGEKGNTDVTDGGINTDKDDTQKGELETTEGGKDVTDESKEEAENKQESGEDDNGQGRNTRRSKRVSVDDTTSRKRTGSSVSTDEAPKKKVTRSGSTPISVKQEGGQPKPKPGLADDENHDKYCWTCHREGVHYYCKICPRSFHAKCINLTELTESSDSTKNDGSATDSPKICVCPECILVMKAENVETRSESLKMLSVEELSTMLTNICERLKLMPGADPFLNPVQNEDAENYYEYIVYPMDIFTLEKNIKLKQYGSTESFLSDAQWIVHNSVIFNSVSSAYTNAAKRLLKQCKQELLEIETCPECYMKAHKNADTWFLEACSRPHILVWAKLKGFPFWPAKAMRAKDDQVDVRFFGQHDRAWVNAKDCFLYSLEMPCAPPKKTAGLNSAIDELNEHVEKLKERFGEVVFAEGKIPIDPSLSVEQLQLFLPKYVEAGSASFESKYPQRFTRTKANELKSAGKGKTADENLKKSEDTKETPKAEVKSEAEEEEHDPRVPSGEILANALGLRRIKRKSGNEAKGNVNPPENQDQKPTGLRKSTRLSNDTTKDLTEGTDEAADGPDESAEGLSQGTKTKSLMEQISNQTQTKPGYRFNISKDISISAIDDSEEEVPAAADRNIERKNVVTRVGGIRADQGIGLKGASGSQKGLMGKDGQNRPLLRPNLAVSATNRPINKQPLRGSLQSTLQPSIRKGKDGSYQPMGEGNTGSLNINQSSQGAITLPGGNITVTPLGSTLPTTSKGTNGLPMSGGNPLRPNKVVRPPAQQPQRNVTSAFPPSVNTQVQQCLKNVEDSIKRTVEQILADANAGKIENKSGPSDREIMLHNKLQRLQKEVVDMKHNYELAIKDMKITFETEKTRALGEQKRRHDGEKMRMATELKKKQWCASCGREANFYCCWNTSYCGYECQERDWPAHMGTCTQGQNGQNQLNQNQSRNLGNMNTAGNQLQNGR